MTILKLGPVVALSFSKSKRAFVIVAGCFTKTLGKCIMKIRFCIHSCIQTYELLENEEQGHAQSTVLIRTCLEMIELSPSC